MAAIFRFVLPSGAALVRVGSTDARLVSQVARAYRRLLVTYATDDPIDVDIWVGEIEAGQRYVVSIPRTVFTLQARGAEMELCQHSRRGDVDDHCFAASETGKSVRLKWEGGCTPDGTGDGLRAHPVVPHVNGLVELMLYGALCDHDANLACIHAGAVVAEDGDAILLLAGSECGKTTTSLALCSRNCRLISDDLALIDLRCAAIHPIRRRPTVRRAHVRDFSLEPFIEHLGAVDDPDDWIVSETIYAAAEWYPIRHVVWLRGFAETAAVEEISPVAALFALVRGSYGVPQNRHVQLQTYANCFRHVSWWQCTLGSPFASADAILAASRSGSTDGRVSVRPPCPT
jgi:hypothetical protein